MRKVYVTVWGPGDVFVDISPTIETKIEALRAHQSQMRDWDPGPMIKEWAADTAKDKEMTYAESYRVVKLISDEEWEKRQKED